MKLAFRPMRTFGLFALGLSAFSACGETAPPADSGDLDGSGGLIGSGAAPSSVGGSGGAVSSGGGSGGAEFGGAGGTLLTGGTAGSGGEESLGGGAGSSGEDGLLFTLGDACSPPGTFACSAENDRLALVCGGSDTWEIRETCDGDDRCARHPGEDLGLCAPLIPECVDHWDEDVCSSGGDAVHCLSGGVEAEAVDTCEFICEEGACVPGDPCPEVMATPTNNQNGCSLVCELHPDGCMEEEPLTENDCFWSAGLSVLASSIASPSKVRLPGGNLCLSSCGDDAPQFRVDVTVISGAARAVAPEGWLITASPCAPRVSCVVVGATGPLFLFPQTDPPIERDLLVEPVDAGTVCP